MVAGLWKRYCIYMPDGGAEHQTMLGDRKIEGDTIRLNGTKWTVVSSLKLMGEEIDYELHVRPAGE